MSKIKTILSIIFIFTIWGCVSSAYPILLWWSRECVLYLIIIIKPEVWIINHCLGLGHETMVCAVCLTMFFLFKVLFMSRILVAVEKMVASCYNWDQTWLCMYCWCQTPSGVVSPRGETTPSGVWHQQYTHNHVWSLKHWLVNFIVCDLLTMLSFGYGKCNN